MIYIQKHFQKFMLVYKWQVKSATNTLTSVWSPHNKMKSREPLLNVRMGKDLISVHI